jgi:hypothetical protein
MITISTAAVASVLQRSASASFPTGEPVGHDAGAHHRHDEKERAERLGGAPPRQIELHCAPCPFSLLAHEH